MHCIVVRRGDYEHYDRLYRAFGDRLPVVWDRRSSKRPAQAATDADAPPPGFSGQWVALGFVVVDRPH